MENSSFLQDRSHPTRITTGFLNEVGCVFSLVTENPIIVSMIVSGSKSFKKKCFDSFAILGAFEKEESNLRASEQEACLNGESASKCGTWNSVRVTLQPCAG